MSFRTFTVIVPFDTNNHNLYSLIVGKVTNTNPHGYGLAQGGTDENTITGAIPSFGILPDRGTFLEIQADGGNSGTVVINDRNSANTTGKILNPGDVFSVDASRNTICFKDYFLKGATQTCEVRFEVA